MNLFFGVASTDPEHLCAQAFIEHVKATYTGEQDPSSHRVDTMLHGFVQGPGKIFGFASRNGVEILFLGFLQRPLEGWDHESSPLDDPNAAAAYVLERYLTHGKGLLDGLFGRFSVAILDTHQQRVLLGVDPYGHNKLFYHLHEGVLRFATQLVTLARGLGQARLRLDRSLEDFFLVHGFRPWQRTPFEGIRYLPGQTLLVWEAGKTYQHTVSSPNPWSTRLTRLDASDVNETEAIELLYQAFMTALEDQLATEPRAAVLLGGFDSSLVAAGLQRLGKAVETFSYIYQDARYNQPHTNTLSRFLGTRHHDVLIDEEVIGGGFRRYPQCFHFPTNWPNYVIQTLHVARRIRKLGFDYCYTGDGCDGIFMGYPLTFERSRLIGLLGRLPQTLNRSLLTLLAQPWLERRLGAPLTVALSVLRAASRSFPERALVSLQVFDPSSLNALRQGDQPPQEADIEEILRQLSAPHRDLDAEQLAYKGKNLVSPGNTKMTAASDVCGLVVTSPYMHAGMAEFAERMPLDLLRPGNHETNIGKHVLSRMALEKGLLPPEIIYQNKVGATDAPLETWYPGALQPLLRELLTHLPFEPAPTYIEAFFGTSWLSDCMVDFSLARPTTSRIFSTGSRC